MNNIYHHRVMKILEERLQEKRHHIQIILGPRQVGKSTAIREVLKKQSCPTLYALADVPSPLGPEWRGNAALNWGNFLPHQWRPGVWYE